MSLKGVPKSCEVLICLSLKILLLPFFKNSKTEKKKGQQLTGLVMSIMRDWNEVLDVEKAL